MKTLFFRTVIFMAALVCCAGCSDDDKADARDAYIGSFKIDEQYINANGVIVKDSYNVTIVKSSVNENDVIMSNILNSGESANVTVTGNSFVIPQQTLKSVGVSGSGRIDGTAIHFSVLATVNGVGQVNFTCDGLKQ